MNRVINERSCSVKITLWYNQIGTANVTIHNVLNNAKDNILHLWLVNVNKPECCKVGSSVFVVFKVHNMCIKTCQKEEISCAYKTNLLGLKEETRNVLFLVGLRIEDV